MKMPIKLFKIFFGAFQLVFKKVKKGFPIVFSKGDLAMAELYFHPFFSENAKPLKIPSSIRFGGFQNLIFTFVHYHPLYLMEELEGKGLRLGKKHFYEL